MPGQKVSVGLELVMLIDATGSMDPYISMVKENALTFHERLIKKLDEYDRVADRVRVKVIAFRDYEVDSTPIEESKFFELPQDAAAFSEFVSKIEATGGGDGPESGWDAIGYAMKSDWCNEDIKNRNVIMMCTDAPSKDPGTGPADNEKLPKSFEDVYTWWQDKQSAVMNQSAKRLILFAPDDPSWELAGELEDTVWTTTSLSSGLEDADLDLVLNVVAKSV